MKYKGFADSCQDCSLFMSITRYERANEPA